MANRLCSLLLMLFALGGCTSLYYQSMKKLGKEKRDILVSRIQDGKQAQEDAAKQFKTALEAFQEVTKFDGGDLEKLYKKLNKQLEEVDGRARKVHDRVGSIDKVAGDLFREWSGEIDKMSRGRLQDESRTLLRDAERRHSALMRQMRGSEEKMTPVVQAFRDQVLFLKHNLNARAITSLKKTVLEIDDDVKALVLDIEKSAQEADKTIAGLTAASES
jgi:hypothetical protein